MKVTLDSASDIGPLVRATRKALGLRQNDTAGTIGVSENFLGKVERGDDSVQWSKLFQVLDQLAIRLTAEIAEQARALHEAETKKLETRRSEAHRCRVRLRPGSTTGSSACFTKQTACGRSSIPSND